MPTDSNSVTKEPEIPKVLIQVINRDVFINKLPKTGKGYSYIGILIGSLMLASSDGATIKAKK